MTRPKLPPITLWTAYLVVGAAFLLVHRVVDGGTLAQSLMYDVVGASARAVDADVAMYQAKALGKGRYHVFDAASGAERASIARAWLERGPTVRLAAPSPLGPPRLEPEAG